MKNRELSDNPLEFIKDRVKNRQLFWTYHVNMRLHKRCIRRTDILGAVEEYEIIESYPEDKYLPSYLVLTETGGKTFHILFATDIENKNVRVITAYEPDPLEWSHDFKNRRREK